jgi:lipopolysaccharide/colanic/teichoic acid biosynthesis glycosyltransferase
MRPHIVLLLKRIKTILIFNKKIDQYVPKINPNAETIHVSINRDISFFQDLLSTAHLAKTLFNIKPKVVMTVAPKAGLLGMITAFIIRVPIRLHIFQGEVWASKKGAYRYLLRFIDSLTSCMATHLLAVSNSEMEFLINQRVVSSKKIKVLGMGSIGGVDLGKFSFDAAMRINIRRRLAIPDEAIVAVFVGRICIDKGVFELFEAFSLVQKNGVKLYLLVVGPDEGCILGSLINQFPDVVKNVRVVPFSNSVQDYLSASDFLCLPSYREGFPVSILEAAAIGIPSIGSRIYGVSDAIKDGETGILVEPKNSSALSVAMTDLILNESLRARLGRAAHTRVLNDFVANEVVLRYVDYIESLINENKFKISVLKRCFDISFSLIALILFSIPSLIVYLGIKITSPGGAIYFSDRVGFNNQIFKMAKFRTMYVDAPITPTHMLSQPDTWITPFGKFLRKSSLDEIPQLWNVLIGQMSIVGPRPALFNQADLIAMRTDKGVHHLLPGLTGWAQVNGRDGLSLHEKLKYDQEYLEKQSIFFDINIVLITFVKVVFFRNVSH